MTRVRDITLGELVDGTKTYRPFVAAVVAIAVLLVVAPAPKSNGNDASVAAATNVAPADQGSTDFTGGAAGVAPTDASVGAANAAPTAAPAAAFQTSGSSSSPSYATAGAGTPAPTAASAPGASGPWGWQAMKTPRALSAPDCDPATGYLRMPTKLWNLPCVPMWPQGADNGGATAPGVSADAIKVIVYNVKSSPATQAAAAAAGIGDTEAQLKTTTAGLLKMFSRHAELYGRKIDLIQFDTDATTPEAQRADAIQAYNKYHPFAVVFMNGSCGATPDFAYQMALRKVEALCAGTSTLPLLMKAEPYLWSTRAESVLPYEGHALFTSEFICKQIVGHNARWAGDLTFRLQKRKFGWLYIDDPNVSAGIKLMRERLAGCGIAVDGVGLSADAAQAQEQITTAIARLKAAGDNVVILDAGYLDSAIATKQATNQNFRPEWIETGFGYTDASIFIRAAYDLTQAQALYGFRETQLMPPYNVGDGNPWYKWENGDFPPAKLLSYNGLFPVWQTLAAGIHLAGPNLTPETFKLALLAKPASGGVFTNSVTSNGRWWGNHGFWPWESKTYFNNSESADGTFTWWSNTATCTDETDKNGPGCMMFINGGRRYTPGRLPTGEPDFFNPSTAIATISELPPNDRPRQYPNKMGCETRWACWGSG